MIFGSSPSKIGFSVWIWMGKGVDELEVKDPWL